MWQVSNTQSEFPLLFLTFDKFHACKFQFKSQSLLQIASHKSEYHLCIYLALGSEGEFLYRSWFTAIISQIAQRCTFSLPKQYCVRINYSRENLCLSISNTHATWKKHFSQELCVRSLSCWSRNWWCCQNTSIFLSRLHTIHKST